MQITHSIQFSTFKFWTSNDPENRMLLKLAAISMIISFSCLKIVYPYPNFMPPDSDSYLEAAVKNQYINLWAIGYSKFLRLISGFTNSHFILVLIQYILLQASVLYFLLSIRYLLSPGKWSFRILFLISILNPLIVHIANFVSTDALFATLSLIWLTQLMWILYEPTNKLLFWHAIIVALSFAVRFTALYYPLISIPILIFSPAPKKLKLKGIVLIATLLGLFIGRTTYEYKIETNTVQYSAFGGWQIASNALYGYAHAEPISIADIPDKFKQLHFIVNKHMDSLRKYPIDYRPDNVVAVYYLWDFKSPLRVYMNQLYPKTTDDEFFYKWATFGPLYASYGEYLIKKHPKEFVKYYLWPNLIKYYTPPTNFMGSYNRGNPTVAPIVVTWFGWKNNRLPSYFSDKNIQVTKLSPILFAAINIVFVLGIISYITSNREMKKNMRLFLMIVSVWIVNMAFSVFAAPIELRYQIFPFVFTLVFSWLLIDYLINQAKEKKVAIINQNPFIRATS